VLGIVFDYRTANGCGQHFIDNSCAVLVTSKDVRSHDAVIRIYDAAGNMIETHEQAGKFKGW
jgi:hypothetical protein